MASHSVLIFARDLAEARAYAAAEGLGKRWVFARDLSEPIRYHHGPIAVLPGFEENPRHDLLAPLAEVLEDEQGPYVPRAATNHR